MLASQGARFSSSLNAGNDSGIRLIKKPDAIAKNDSPITGAKGLLEVLVAADSAMCVYRLIKVNNHCFRVLEVTLIIKFARI